MNISGNPRAFHVCSRLLTSVNRLLGATLGADCGKTGTPGFPHLREEKPGAPYPSVTECRLARFRLDIVERAEFHARRQAHEAAKERQQFAALG